MLVVLGLAAVAKPLPAWNDVLLPEHIAPYAASFAPDGRGLLWREVDGDEAVIQLRWLPEDTPVEPALRLPKPDTGRIVLNWARPAIPHVLVMDGEERTHWIHGPDGWVEDDARQLQFSVFAGAPDVEIRWQRTGRRRFDVARIVNDVVTHRWPVRFRRGDRPLWDSEGHLRAVGHAKRRVHRYVGTEAPFVLRYVPAANPFRRRADLRRPSFPLTVVEDTLWAIESRGHEHSAVVTVELPTGHETTVFEDPEADVVGLLVHPDTGVPDLAYVLDAMPRWHALDPSLEEDLAFVSSRLPRPARFVLRARGDRRWHVCGTSAAEGTRCVFFDRDTRDLVPTLRSPPSRGAPIPPTRPIRFETDDGLELDHFLVLPPDVAGVRPESPLPAVVLVHGGPFARVDGQHDPMRAFLASRGYAVLDVNYRGSTMMGREVLEAGTGERGRAIEGDVEAARDWLVAQHIADPDRIAVLGHSYGGYSTLLQLARHPDRWACGVAMAPQAGWSYRWLVWALPRSLRRRAPYTQLEHIADPLLLVHGRDDDVIPVSESRHVARALQRRGQPVTLIEVDDTHGLAGPGVEAMTANAVEGFLSGCLDGRRAPLATENWPDSAAIVTGRESLDR